MWLSHLYLEQFRCYRRLDLQIPEQGLRIAGENASGKTSLLEAIQLLATTRSTRAATEQELMHWESNKELQLPPYSRVFGSVRHSHGETMLEVRLSVDTSRPTHSRKQVRLDGTPRRAVDLVGHLKTVLFEPEDMELVLGSPSGRRRHLDVALSTLNPTYLRTLSQYGKLLEQRNSLLKQLREARRSSGGNRVAELDYWNEELVTRAAYITSTRIRFLSMLAGPLGENFEMLVDRDLELSASYTWDDEESETSVSRIIEADEADAQRHVAQRLERALDERRDEELARGVTVVGPHRHDFTFLLGGRELSSFGSRGQQRLAVVSLKLAEVEVIRDHCDETPLLLLDDVLSELDVERRERMLLRIGALGSQVIVTATDYRLLQHPALDSLPLFRVTEGEIQLEKQAAS